MFKEMPRRSSSFCEVILLIIVKQQLTIIVFFNDAISQIHVRDANLNIVKHAKCVKAFLYRFDIFLF